MQGRLFTIMAVVLISVLGISAQGLAGGFFFHKACRGVLGNEEVSHAASHFQALGGDGRNAGAVVSSTGRTECLGKIEVGASASWDWGFFKSNESNNAIEEEAHPCALMNITPHTFSADNDDVGNGFTAEAKVVIRKRFHGHLLGTIEASIRGGSVCEIEVISANPPCTINEAMTAFEIEGSDGIFGWITQGSGILHTVFNFCTGEFLRNEIFLHLNK